MSRRTVGHIAGTLLGVGLAVSAGFGLRNYLDSGAERRLYESTVGEQVAGEVVATPIDIADKNRIAELERQIANLRDEMTQYIASSKSESTSPTVKCFELKNFAFRKGGQYRYSCFEIEMDNSSSEDKLVVYYFKIDEPNTGNCHKTKPNAIFLSSTSSTTFFENLEKMSENLDIPSWFVKRDLKTGRYHVTIHASDGGKAQSCEVELEL